MELEALQVRYIGLPFSTNRVPLTEISETHHATCPYIKEILLGKL